MSEYYVRCAAQTAKGVQCSREVAYTGADFCTQHGVVVPHRGGWYGMACWNALSTEQQNTLLHVGVLPWGRKQAEGGTCDRLAEVAVETMGDDAPGPRFYCRGCAIAYLVAHELVPLTWPEGDSND